jgi:hypothetical protein
MGLFARQGAIEKFVEEERKPVAIKSLPLANDGRRERLPYNLH